MTRAQLLRLLLWLWEFATEYLSFGLLIAAVVFILISAASRWIGQYAAEQYFWTGITAGIVGVVLIFAGILTSRWRHR